MHISIIIIIDLSL